MHDQSTVSIDDPCFQACLRLLWNARRYACDAERPVWDFAMRLDEVTGVGVGPSELRYLISKGWVAHGEDQACANDVERLVHPRHSLVFGGHSCFVLTDAGAERFASQEHSRAATDATPALCPRWDAVRHELRVGGLLVKRFRSPAINQEAILSAFEEEHWPARIDDPLSPVGETDPKRRLCDTIKCLNRNQTRERVRFRGDGTGEGVLWCFGDDDRLITPNYCDTL